MELIMYVLLGLSSLANLILAYFLYKKPSRKESIELTEFLSDLAAGPALIKVTRVDPASVFIRSSRERL